MSVRLGSFPDTEGKQEEGAGGGPKTGTQVNMKGEVPGSASGPHEPALYPE